MTKFTATFEGQIVGTRNSEHGYAFAVIVKNDIEAHRAFAYGYVGTKPDRHNYDWYAVIAQQQPGVDVLHKGWNYPTRYTVKEIENAKAKIEGGFEGYVARIRQRLITAFDANVAEGYFNPTVFGWSKTRVNAEKMARKIGSCQMLLAIAPAEA